MRSRKMTPKGGRGRCRAITGVIFVVVTAGVATSLTSCSSGPSSRQEVCSAFDKLGDQFLQGNGIIGNPLFHRAGDLADAAQRFTSQGVRADGVMMDKVAHSHSVSGADLMSATGRIADLCGHPLALGHSGP